MVEARNSNPEAFFLYSNFLEPTVIARPGTVPLLSPTDMASLDLDVVKLEPGPPSVDLQFKISTYSHRCKYR